MPKIILITKIKASQKLVFDLSRSIDLHLISTEKTNEKAIAGRTEGLIELGEIVTWRAKHLGVYQNFTSKVTGCKEYSYFADKMVSGAFKSFTHEHHFKQEAGFTLMTDKFYFESPLGILGKLANKLFLTRYMENLLKTRNAFLKQRAESA